MKAKIEGIEIECTPHEFRELLKEFKTTRQHNETLTPLEVPVKGIDTKEKPLFRRGFMPWSETEIRLLKKVSSEHLSLGEIQKKYFPERHTLMVCRQLKQLGIKRTRVFPNSRAERIRRGLKPLKQTNKRRGFVHNKAVSLMGQYGYTYEKALEMARGEWRKNMGFKPLGANPLRNILKSPYDDVLKSMLLHIANNGGYIRFADVATTLNIDNIGGWFDFLALFTKHLTEVNMYMGLVSNKKGEYKIIDNTIKYKD